MAISQRIRFNDTGESAGAYSLILNPSHADLKDDSGATFVDTLDGGRIIQNKYFDSRPINFSWVRIPYDYSGFQTMLTVLKGYVGSVKYYHMGSAEYRVAGTGWNKIRVADVKMQVIKGGKLKYNVEMIMFPEP